MFTYIRFQNHSLEKWMTVTLLTLVQQSMVILFFFFGYPCVPLFDARYFWIYNFIAFCWNVAFNRALGTGEPLFNMNSGRLQASLDRVETILTHSSWYSLKNQVGLYLDLFWLLRYFENHTEYFPEGNELRCFLLILAVEVFLY